MFEEDTGREEYLRTLQKQYELRQVICAVNNEEYEIPVGCSKFRFNAMMKHYQRYGSPYKNRDIQA